MMDPGRPTVSTLAEDLLEGAIEIGRFLFGDGPGARQRVYKLTSVVKPEDRLPVFRIGNILFARKSTLMQWVTEREGQAWRPEPPPPTPSARRFPKHLLDRYR